MQIMMYKENMQDFILNCKFLLSHQVLQPQDYIQASTSQPNEAIKH